MPISKLTGPMLSNILVRDGEGIAFSNTANSTPLLYIDIANARIGVNTDAPNTAFTINGAGYASSLNLTNNISLGGDVIANGNAIITNITAAGNVTTGNLTATGFANAVNISASGNINAFANIVSGNVNTGNFTATGFANAVNISASGNINAFANIFAGNVNANTLTSTNNLSVSGTANISLLNVNNMSISGNISGNLNTSTAGNIVAGNINITGQATLGNITINNTTISSVGNVVIFAGTAGVAVPVGNIAQRPGNVPSGTLRFNSENDSLETWDGADWINTSAQPSTIYDQQITGNNGTTYTLTESVTDENNLIVTIQGLTQLPGTAYTVVGNTIVFAQPLLSSEVADIRYLTYPVGVPDYGNANVAAYLAGSVGNIIPSANITYSLGNATNQWKSIYVGANTLYINNVAVSVTSSNVLQVGGENVITANSSTTGNITATNFIGSGSLLTSLPAPSVAQDITSVGAMSLMTYDGNLKYVSYATVEPSSGNITGGNISATGNIRGNFFIGNGSQLTGIAASANTGNVTFNDVNIIGTGNLKLQPNIANNEYLDIYLTAAEDIHIAATGAGPGNVILGTDEGANVAVLWEGNVAIQAGNVGGTKTWTFDTAGNLTLPANTFAVKYANGDPVTFSGGSGNTGNVTFNDQIVLGTGSNDGGGGLYLAPGNDSIANSEVQYLRVRGGDYPTHIHLDTGNNQYYDQYFGADDKFVKLEANGNVLINASNLANNSSATWTFDDTGDVTIPGNIQSVTTGFPFSSNISGINTGSPTVLVTLVDSVFGAPETGQVTITGVVGTTEANNTWYYGSIDPSNFVLYNDAALTDPVDGTTWTAYVSDGLAVSQGYNNLSITGGNVSIVTNTGNTWIFGTDGNLTIPNNIISNTTIDIDNRASGNSADIRLFAADDITIQARDRSAGSTTEGGDINIFAGDSAEDSDTSAGDIVIEAGRGGASNIDFGGSGGFVRVEAGDGGDAIGANFSARPGGSLTLNAGHAGSNNGNIDLGAAGANVYIGAGDSTGNGVNGGTIYLTSGAADASALAGDVVIQAGGTWTFGSDGRLTFPGTPRIDTDSNNFEVQAAESISLEANAVVNIYTDTSGNAYQWQFGDDGSLTFPIGISIDDNVDPLYPKIIADSGKLFSVQGQGANGSAALAWSLNPNTDTQYAAVGVNKGGGDDLAKVVLTAGNTTATLKVWKFDETGNLTAPGNISAVGNVIADSVLILGSISPAAIASPAPTLSGFSSVSAINISASGNITAGNVLVSSRGAIGIAPQQEIHVARNGSDADGNGSITNPYRTISYALTLAGSGTVIVVHPGGYTEDVAINNLNNIALTAAQPGAASPQSYVINGNVTVSGTSGSVLLHSVGVVGSITHSSSGSFFVTAIQMGTGGNSTTFDKTGTGYLEVTNGNWTGGTPAVTVTGAGLVTFNGVQLTNLTVNNANASVLLRNVPSAVNTTLTSGTLTVISSTMIGNSNTAPAITTVAGTLNIQNSILLRANNAAGIMTVGAATAYLYDDIFFDRTNSTLSGIPISGTAFAPPAEFQAVRADSMSVSGNVTASNVIVGNTIVLSGSIIGSGASPAPTLSGFSSVSAINLSASGNITGNTIISNKSLTLAIYADNAARDAAIPTPANGMLIFNTAAANFQGYNGSWGNLTLS